MAFHVELFGEILAASWTGEQAPRRLGIALTVSLVAASLAAAAAALTLRGAFAVARRIVIIIVVDSAGVVVVCVDSICT